MQDLGSQRGARVPPQALPLPKAPFLAVPCDGGREGDGSAGEGGGRKAQPDANHGGVRVELLAGRTRGRGAPRSEGLPLAAVQRVHCFEAVAREERRLADVSRGEAGVSAGSARGEPPRVAGHRSPGLAGTAEGGAGGVEGEGESVFNLAAVGFGSAHQGARAKAQGGGLQEMAACVAQARPPR
ncbi:MAG: hypothetical protein SGPRY_003333 [Prymnesium sp.]